LEIFSQFKKDLITKQSLQQNYLSSLKPELCDEKQTKLCEKYEDSNVLSIHSAPDMAFSADIFNQVLIKSEVFMEEFKYNDQQDTFKE
jgi:hypothetical protein